jgi:hypothetical protein
MAIATDRVFHGLSRSPPVLNCKEADGAAPESNRPSVGLPRRTGFEGLQSQSGLATEAGFDAACGQLGSTGSVEIGRRFSRRSRATQPIDHESFGIEFGVAIMDAT